MLGGKYGYMEGHDLTFMQKLVALATVQRHATPVT